MADVQPSSAEMWNSGSTASFSRSDRGALGVGPSAVASDVSEATVFRGGAPLPGEGTTLPRRGAIGPSRTRRLLPGALILFIGAAFVVATLTGASGFAFTALVLASSLLLVLIIGYLAFGGSQVRANQTLLEEFAFAEAPAPPLSKPHYIAVSGWVDGPPVMPSTRDPAAPPVKAFVQNLAPSPPHPNVPLTPAIRRKYLQALRWEGKQLIGIARVTGVDVEPYRSYLLDARTAASRGDLEKSLSSIRLANELLRGAVENALLKHQRLSAEGRGPRSR